VRYEPVKFRVNQRTCWVQAVRRLCLVVNAEEELSVRHCLLRQYDLSLKVSALCLTELFKTDNKNGIVRNMIDTLGNNASFLCKIGLEILGSKIIILRLVS
jgi:hypothetical protein